MLDGSVAALVQMGVPGRRLGALGVLRIRGSGEACCRRWES